MMRSCRDHIDGIVAIFANTYFNVSNNGYLQILADGDGGGGVG